MKALLAALLSLCCCLAQAEERTVRIYNWIEYLPPEVLQQFQAETGIRPIYDTFDSIDMLQTKLLTGNSGYDVVFPSTANLHKLIKAGAIQPLDKSKLPNLGHLDADFMQKIAAVGDPGNQYAVPYMWGTTLIGYNLDKVRQALGGDSLPDSWALLFDERNISRLARCGVGFIDAPDEILPIAMRYLGLDPNSSNPEDFRKAQALMQKIRPHIAYFNSSRFAMDLANGDTCVSVGWSGGFALAEKLAAQADKGVRLDMLIPREGVPMWSDVMVIPKGARSAEAHAFIDFILRPEVIARASNAVGYPNPNKDATALVDAHIRQNPNMYVPAERQHLLYPLTPQPLSTERARTRAWSAIRTGI